MPGPVNSQSQIQEETETGQETALGDSDAIRGSTAPTDKHRQISAGRKLLFALVTLVGCVAILEGFLVLAGVQKVDSVERMQFTFPIDDYNNNAPEPFLKRDPVLFWTPRPGVQGHNSQGFYGPEFNEHKPSDVFRIVCLGDSCTHFGPQPYPAMLQELLNQSQTAKFEVINAGVIGYTSYQGKRLLETRVKNWSPDLITCYFGWNDHWLAAGVTDSQQSAGNPGLITGLAEQLRTVQAIRLLTSGGQKASREVRVPEDEYQENLAAIASLGRDLGSDVWFITAPHAMDLSIPEYLLTSGEVEDPDLLIPMHQSYNAKVRLVAKESDSQMIDLEKITDGLEKQELFIDDHIHLSLKGKRLLANELGQRILTQNGHEDQ